MAARSNAISEITRFWLQARHKCLIDESLPVKVPKGNSDIDFVAMKSNLQPFTLPSGNQIGPRLIVETKAEHDYDPNGSSFARDFLKDLKLIGEKGYVAEGAKVKFTMLRQEHYQAANMLFETCEFDRLFVVHALKPALRDQIEKNLNPDLHIHLLEIGELIDDLRQWYIKHEHQTGLRNSLTGDIWHLLVGFCHYGPNS